MDYRFNTTKGDQIQRLIRFDLVVAVGGAEVPNEAQKMMVGGS